MLQFVYSECVPPKLHAKYNVKVVVLHLLGQMSAVFSDSVDFIFGRIVSCSEKALFSLVLRLIN